MFSDNLALNLLIICDARKLTYQAASELCDVSTRHFGDIVRHNTAISVGVLEKICIGLQVTPNDLLLEEYYVPTSKEKAATVTETQKIQTMFGYEEYSLCPTCKIPIDREYQNFCDNCGQRLSWTKYASFIK